MLLVIGNLAIEGVDADGGQVRHSVKLRLVALALMSIEFYLSNVAACIRGTNITNIEEAFRAGNISMRNCSDSASLADDVERQSIHEVGTVGTFKHA